MSDQTKHDIDEVITKNHIKNYENETRKKFENWLEQCPVMFANTTGFGDPEIKIYKFNLRKRR
tara:strand:- start:2419 stop:2607 length:189 start_codon:yes stop_codon:yes gene_type:complete